MTCGVLSRKHLLPFCYELLDVDFRGIPSVYGTCCDCAWSELEDISPEELVKHIVEENSHDAPYWGSLSALTQQHKSKSLAISLVL